VVWVTAGAPAPQVGPQERSMPAPGKRVPLVTAGVLGLALLALAIYGKPGTTQRGEFFNIARALARGEGFSHPFTYPVGPTAWMAPGFPVLLAGLFRLGDGDPGVVNGALLALHFGVLLGTMGLVLALSRQTTERVGIIVAATIFLLVTLQYFANWFQYVDDAWVMLLTLNLMIAGLCWGRPLARWPRAATWGVLGGLITLVNPIAGFAWGAVSLAVGARQRAWRPLATALCCACLTVAPWMVRNYLVLGRLFLVKSNLAYELYQSQCLQPDGLLQSFRSHPSGGLSPEGLEYREIGETAYLDRKWQKFVEAVQADPEDFLNRVSDRFLGATLWYAPFNRSAEANPWLLWPRRLIHPLPFLALLFLIATSIDKPLSLPQWTVIGVYLCYLLPYIVISFYERYAAPLLAVKVLLIVWGLDRLLRWIGPRALRSA
jgi:hypothetical protein